VHIDIPAHEAAAFFPMLGCTELAGLAADVRKNGLIHLIMLTADGEKIADGYNRYMACKVAGMKPRYERPLTDQSVEDFVIGADIHCPAFDPRAEARADREAAEGETGKVGLRYREDRKSERQAGGRCPGRPQARCRHSAP
jgi:hypothetical protein